MKYEVLFKEYANKYIKRDGIDKLLESLSKTDFYTAPASTRFHDSHEGGLVKHSVEVFEHLKNITEKNKTGYDMESVAIVSLFHDICKVHFYKVEMRNSKENGKWVKVPYYTVDDKLPLGHGEKSIIMIREFMELSVDEMLAIRWHMGGFVPKEEYLSIGKAYEQCPLALDLHFADMRATYL